MKIMSVEEAEENLEIVTPIAKEMKIQAEKAYTAAHEHYLIQACVGDTVGALEELLEALKVYKRDSSKAQSTYADAIHALCMADGKAAEDWIKKEKMMAAKR